MTNRPGVVQVRAAAIAVAFAASVAVPATMVGAQTTSPRTHVAIARSLMTHLPLGAMPKAMAGVRPASALSSAHLTYYGGPVLTHINSIEVKWGAGSADSYQPFISTNYPGGSTATFTREYLRSPLIDWLNQYDTPVSGGTGQAIGEGTFGGLITITPSVTATTIQDSQVQNELVAQILAGHLPVPTANASYAIFFPKGDTICQGGACSGVDFCAYHGTFMYGSVTATYQVMPDNQVGSGDATGCGTGTAFENETAVLSHELAETITDPDVGFVITTAPPLAWYDPTNGEIGDICNGEAGTFVGSDGVTYTAQYEFSNLDDGCVLTSNARAPYFTSLPSTTFTKGSFGTFTPTAGGYPTPTISESGALPNGVSWSGGVLSGTPTVVGTFPITLTAHNGAIPDATQPFTLTVGEAPLITSAAATTFVKGVKGSFTVTSTAYPAAQFSSVGPLPSGVSLSTAGTLSGKPTSTGTFTFTIEASNGVSPPAMQAFSLKVVSILITTVTLGTATRGTHYSLQLTHLGGVPRLVWSNTLPKLPKGLSMSSRGKITGTVSASIRPGSYSVGIAVHDSAMPIHHKAKAVLTIVVK